MASTSPFARLRLPALPEDPTHPVQIALRTYGLALSLAVVPGLTPIITSVATSKKPSHAHLSAIRRLLARELGLGGFAFAVTTAIAGGAALRVLWDALDNTDNEDKAITPNLNCVRQILDALNFTAIQKTLVSYCLTSSVAIVLLQTGRHRPIVHSTPKPSRTLELTLLLFVRAVDALVQSFVFHRTSRVRDQTAKSSRPEHAELRPDAIRQRLLKERHDMAQKEKRDVLTTRIDGLVFWASSARIMWCFFYEPTKLPRSYVRWIGALANLDGRLLRTLQLIREKQWSYIRGSPKHGTILETFSADLGHPAVWGNPTVLPAYGGLKANYVWDLLGVCNRLNLGGLPCEIVHGGVGSSLGLEHSCTANAVIRALKAFLQAVVIYLPVHFIPPLLTNPRLLLRPHRLFRTLISAARSASFLSAFISSYWYAVCLTRSLVLARALPFVSHDFWDGPFGCIMAGCLTCGSSIWIEHPRRRGEMSMYVLPRAVRTLLPEALVQSGHRGLLAVERLVFVLSLSYLVTTAVHKPDSLRGLSRWALAFVTNGPSAGFWQKRRSFDPSLPGTPILPVSPSIPSAPAPRYINDTTPPVEAIQSS